MNLHPDVWLALAHQRHEELVSQARRSRLAAEAHTAWRDRRHGASHRAPGTTRRAAPVPRPAC